MTTPPTRSGPSGTLALLLSVGWILGGWCYPVPMRFGREEERITVLAFWGVGFAVLTGIGLASVRFGPAPSRGAAVVALVIDVVCLGLVVAVLAREAFRQF